MLAKMIIKMSNTALQLTAYASAEFGRYTSPNIYVNA